MTAFLLGLFVAWSQLAVPELSSPVVDQSGVFSADLKRSLEDELRGFQQTGKAQIQILIIPTLEGEAIEDYSIRVVEKWKLGTQAKDNGVLILLVTQDRKSRIEVGQGLEGELTDAHTKRILAERSRPFFQRGDYASGIRAAALSVMDQLHGDQRTGFEESVAGTLSDMDQRASRTQLILFLFVFIIFVLSRIFGRRRMGFRKGAPYGGWGTGVGGWSGGSSGWGSGGGGWSGGGGGFSGGGSSDSW